MMRTVVVISCILAAAMLVEGRGGHSGGHGGGHHMHRREAPLTTPQPPTKLAPKLNGTSKDVPPPKDISAVRPERQSPIEGMQAGMSQADRMMREAAGDKSAPKVNVTMPEQPPRKPVEGPLPKDGGAPREARQMPPMSMSASMDMARMRRQAPMSGSPPPPPAPKTPPPPPAPKTPPPQPKQPAARPPPPSPPQKPVDAKPPMPPRPASMNMKP